MDPVSAIVWICVAVFAATSVITLLALVGKVRLGRTPAAHDRFLRLLFRSLVIQVVLASVGAFAAYVRLSPDDDESIEVANIRFVDDFDRASAFETVSETPDGGQVLLAAGMLVVSAKEEELTYFPSPPINFDSSINIEVDVCMLKGPAGGSCGLAFSSDATQDAFYAFQFMQDGRYLISFHRDNQQRALKMAKSAAISLEVGTFHSLGVKIRGQTVSCAVNGVPIGVFDIADDMSGSVGLYADAGTVAKFDNLRVWQVTRN